jgi:hypothetical protein
MSRSTQILLFENHLDQKAMGNAQGVPVAAGCGHIQGIGSALQVEAIPTLQAIKITSQMGCMQASTIRDGPLCLEEIYPIKGV